MTATFMPKPLFEDNASGMHVHRSLWKGETNLFYDKADYAELSELGRYYIGGLLTHAWALCALCAPTTNSYRRLVPGYEAPINLVYSQRNRSACCRIPMYSSNPRAKRVEFRSPDPSCNPYLACAPIPTSFISITTSSAKQHRSYRLFLQSLLGGRCTSYPARGRFIGGH